MSKLLRNAKYLGSGTGIVVLKRNLSTPQHWQVKCGVNNHDLRIGISQHAATTLECQVQMVLSWNVGD